MLNSEFVHCMRTTFDPFMPNGITQHYQLKQPISVLRDVRWYISFVFKLCKQTVEALIRHRVRLWRLIWVCTICLCPRKRTLGIYGLKCNYLACLLRVAETWEVYCRNNLPSECALGTSGLSKFINMTIL